MKLDIIDYTFFVVIGLAIAVIIHSVMQEREMQNKYTRERTSSTSRKWDKRNKRKVKHKERQLAKRAIKREEV